MPRLQTPGHARFGARGQVRRFTGGRCSVVLVRKRRSGGRAAIRYRPTGKRTGAIFPKIRLGKNTADGITPGVGRSPAFMGPVAAGRRAENKGSVKRSKEVNAEPPKGVNAGTAEGGECGAAEGG
jgi:hypothetical protein